MALVFKLWFHFVLVSIILKLLALPQLPENTHLYHVVVEVNVACRKLFLRNSYGKFKIIYYFYICHFIDSFLYC